MSAVRVRFAPSPTGKLHVGNIRAALVNVLFAKAKQGTFVLRFEDTDIERNVADAEIQMMENLAWLGLVPDESVAHGGDYAPYRTRERAERGDYTKALEQLMAKNLAYECYCTKEELDMIRRLRTSRGLPPGYDNRHRDLTPEQKEQFKAEGRDPVVRFRLEDGPIEFDDMVRGKVRFEAEHLGGDPVIIRSNGIPTFAFAGAVDDIHQAITHVIRGEDHVTNTAIQVRIFEALAGKVPAFAHMPMLLDNDGNKLSKRLDSLSVSHMKAEGYLPEAIVSYLSAAGTSVDPYPGTIDELAARFDFANMGRAPVRFDLDQVKRLNAMLIHTMSWADAQTRLHEVGLLPQDLPQTAAQLEAFWLAVRPNLTLLREVKEQYDLCFGEVEPAQLPAEDAAYIRQAEAALPHGPYDAQTWQVWVTALKEQTGRKGKALFMPLRLALTGLEHGPELGDLLPVIGEDRARQRLQQAQQ